MRPIRGFMTVIPIAPSGPSGGSSSSRQNMCVRSFPIGVRNNSPRPDTHPSCAIDRSRGGSHVDHAHTIAGLHSADLDRGFRLDADALSLITEITTKSRGLEHPVVLVLPIGDQVPHHLGGAGRSWPPSRARPASPARTRAMPISRRAWYAGARSPTRDSPGHASSS